MSEQQNRSSLVVELAIKLGGLAIALAEGWLALSGRSADISPPLLALAGLMMGVARAMRFDRERRE